ncbi:DUF4838 domain-containing protein [candidate division KSB1 bacterium]|nr:DUF4838 domain-containing protein [candidate division KSB1 bacterium]
MRIQSRLFLIGALICLVACESKLTLVDSGKSPYRIYIAEGAPEVVQFSARELRQTILEMTGVALPIKTGVDSVATPAIFIGTAPGLSDKLQAWHPEPFGDEEFLIKTEGKSLYILGGEPRGVLYGVISLLTEEWGCRWYTTDAVKLPDYEKLILPALEKTGQPAFEYREVFFSDVMEPAWCIHNRTNRSLKVIPDSMGGQFGIYPFVHTFYSLVPPDIYFKSNPAYFSLVNGKRQGHEAQLCLTNQDVVAIATRQALKWIDEHPGVNVITIDQNDGGGWCQCEQCRTLDDAQGSQSGSILNFVNQIADTIARYHPEVTIQTLAYYYSEKPPATILPRKNVMIRLCRYAEYCDAHPIEGCKVNKPFIERIEQWHAIAPKLMIWDYYTDFRHYLMPFPNFDGVTHDIRFYKEHGVAGIFAQGSYTKHGGGELAELRGWVLAQMLWNPYQNGQALIEEFVREVYGSAAPYLLDYLTLLHHKVRTDSIHFNMYADPHVGHLTPDIVGKANQLFTLAEKAVENDSVLLARVQLAYMPVLFTKLYFYTAGGKIYLNDAEMPAVLDKFMGIANRLGITQLDESNRGDLHAFSENVRKTKGIFLTKWWVIGPFDNPDGNGLKEVYAPECEFDTLKTYTGCNGADIDWRIYERISTGYMDFTKFFNHSEYGVAYARTALEAAEDGTLQMGVGSNDGVRLWINDQLVLDKAVTRLALPNQEIVTVPIKKGENTVLLKIDQVGGGWGFYFSILDGSAHLKGI